MASWLLRLGVPLALMAGGTAPSMAQTAGDDPVKRGEYIFNAAGCLGCHTESKEAPRLAGGRALKTPFGTFYGPNITPDPETGIGGWTDEDFIRALREGYRVEAAGSVAEAMERLDAQRFAGALGDGTHGARVEAQADGARALGARGTPTFFINGERYHGDSDHASLASALKKALDDN